MRFYNPNNFKQGQLIMSRYYPKELVILVVSILTTAVLTIVVGTIAMGTGRPLALGIFFLFSLLPAGSAFVFLHPKEGYHNAYYYFKLKRTGKKMQKKYMWEGIQYDDSDD